jgi:putative phosphoribosyl transferase
MQTAGDQVFADRFEAGRILAGALVQYAGREDVVVLGLPRGGVPVAAEVAKALRVPLDVLVVRKLGAPGQEELAIGAIGEGGVRLMTISIALRCARRGNWSVGWRLIGAGMTRWRWRKRR